MKKLLIVAVIGITPLFSSEQSAGSQRFDSSSPIVDEHYRNVEYEGELHAQQPQPSCSANAEGSCPHCNHINAQPYQKQSPYQWANDPYPDL